MPFQHWIETVEMNPRRVVQAALRNEDHSTAIWIECKEIDAHDFAALIIKALEATEGPDYKELAEKFTRAAFGVYCSSITAHNFVTDSAGRWLLIREDVANALVEVFSEARDAGLLPSAK